VEVRKDVRAALVEGGSVRSDGHTPRGALEQSHPQVLLEALHQVAHVVFDNCRNPPLS